MTRTAFFGMTYEARPQGLVRIQPHGHEVQLTNFTIAVHDVETEDGTEYIEFTVHQDGRTLQPRGQSGPTVRMMSVGFPAFKDWLTEFFPDEDCQVYTEGDDLETADAFLRLYEEGQ